MNLFLKIRNIIVGNWRNLTGYTSDETVVKEIEEELEEDDYYYEDID